MRNKYTILALALGLVLLPASALAGISTNLSYGSTGPQVLELQDFLNSGGYLSVAPTGNFYSLTLKAVEAYQKANGIPSTGYVGMLTRASVNASIDALTASSTEEQVQETGTTTPAASAPSSPVTDAISQQNALLQQELAQQEETNQLLKAQTPSASQPIVASAPAPMVAAYDPSCVPDPNINITLSTSTLSVMPYNPSEDTYDTAVNVGVQITSNCVFNPDSFISVDVDRGNGSVSIDNPSSLVGGTGMFGKVSEINQYHNDHSIISADGKTITFNGNVNIRTLSASTQEVIVAIDEKNVVESPIIVQ